MTKVLTIGMAFLAVLAIASCDLFGVDAPELQVLVRANPGETPGDMGPGNEIYFGKPGDGVNEDVVFIIRNSGTANLVLEASGPHYVAIVDQNEAQEPFSVLTGAPNDTIAPGKEVQVTVRFTGQAQSTRYTAKLSIPSNDPEHPGFHLELVGDGDGFN